MLCSFADNLNWILSSIPVPIFLFHFQRNFEQSYDVGVQSNISFQFVVLLNWHISMDFWSYNFTSAKLSCYRSKPLNAQHKEQSSIYYTQVTTLVLILCISFPCVGGARGCIQMRHVQLLLVFKHRYLWSFLKTLIKSFVTDTFCQWFTSCFDKVCSLVSFFVFKYILGFGFGTNMSVYAISVDILRFNKCKPVRFCFLYSSLFIGKFAALLHTTEVKNHRFLWQHTYSIAYLRIEFSFVFVLVSARQPCLCIYGQDV